MARNRRRNRTAVVNPLGTRMTYAYDAGLIGSAHPAAKIPRRVAPRDDRWGVGRGGRDGKGRVWRDGPGSATRQHQPLCDPEERRDEGARSGTPTTYAYRSCGNMEVVESSGSPASRSPVGVPEG